MRILSQLLLVAAVTLTLGSAKAQNSVYIDQVGSNSTISVSQTGSENQAGNPTNGTILHGDSQTVSIQQIGSLNSAAVNIQGAGVTANISANGSSNNMTVNCGATGGAGAACTDSNISSVVQGDVNQVDITGGAKSALTANVTGSHNTVGITSTTSNMNGAIASATVTGGDGNNVTINQNGPAGLNGFSATVSVNGASNTVGVQQSGTVDSTVTINSSGSNNNIHVVSGN